MPRGLLEIDAQKAENKSIFKRVVSRKGKQALWLQMSGLTFAVLLLALGGRRELDVRVKVQGPVQP